MQRYVITSGRCKSMRSDRRFVDAASPSFGLSSAPPDGFRGSVGENLPGGSPVDLDVPIRANGGRAELLCRVDVVRHHGEIRVPFEVGGRRKRQTHVTWEASAVSPHV